MSEWNTGRRISDNDWNIVCYNCHPYQFVFAKNIVRLIQFTRDTSHLPRSIARDCNQKKTEVRWRPRKLFVRNVKVITSIQDFSPTNCVTHSTYVKSNANLPYLPRSLTLTWYLFIDDAKRLTYKRPADAALMLWYTKQLQKCQCISSFAYYIWNVSPV